VRAFWGRSSKPVVTVTDRDKALCTEFAWAREPHVVFSAPVAKAVLYNVVHELWGRLSQQLPCAAS
jgi:hypothetical protein